MTRVTGDVQAEILHVHLGVVDEILQRVSTGIIVFELGVVGDDASSRIIGVHQTTDVHHLDVGEVSKDPGAGCTGGLEATFMVKSRTENNSNASTSGLPVVNLY